MNKITIAFYIIGIFFFVLAGKLWIENTNQNEFDDKYISVNEPFNFNDFINILEPYGDIPELDHSKITALFIMNSNSCNQCINEIINYNLFLEEKKINDQPIQQLIILLDRNKKKTLRFIKTTEFITAVFFGYDERFTSSLQKFADETVTSQLIFVDSKRNNIFFRVNVLQGRIGSIEDKQTIFHEVEKAYAKETEMIFSNFRSFQNN